MMRVVTGAVLVFVTAIGAVGCSRTSPVDPVAAGAPPGPGVGAGEVTSTPTVPVTAPATSPGTVPATRVPASSAPPEPPPAAPVEDERPLPTTPAPEPTRTPAPSRAPRATPTPPVVPDLPTRDDHIRVSRRLTALEAAGRAPRSDAFVRAMDAACMAHMYIPSCVEYLAHRRMGPTHYAATHNDGTTGVTWLPGCGPTQPVVQADRVTGYLMHCR